MEFTKENWENAPEGAEIWYSLSRNGSGDARAHLIGWSAPITLNDISYPVIQVGTAIEVIRDLQELLIVIPKRKVTVQLWRTDIGNETAVIGHNRFDSWTLLGEHTIEID